MSERSEAAAQQVAALPKMLGARGIDMPQELLDEIAVYQAAVNYLPQNTVDLAAAARTVKAEDVPALLDRAIDATVRADAARPHRADLLKQLGDRLNRAAKAAMPAIISNLAAPFNTEADAFSAAFAVLPADYTDSAQLVRAGATAVDAYHQASEHAAELTALAGLRDLLAFSLEVVAPGDPSVEQGTRYAEVRNTGSARRALEAQPDHALGKWGALLRTNGVLKLRWLSLEDHAAYIAGLKVVEDHHENVVTNGFKGTRLVEA